MEEYQKICYETKWIMNIPKDILVMCIYYIKGDKKVMRKYFQNILIKIEKKNWVAMLASVVILTAGSGILFGCSATKENSQLQQKTDSNQTGLNASDEESKSSSQQFSKQIEKLVYIEKFDGKELVFDEVEWVEVPGKRAKELGIKEDDAPSGFKVYNEEVMTEELPVTRNCICDLLNWTSNYDRMQVTLNKFMKILEDRKGTKIPYYLTIEDNKIICITEHYVP